MYLKSHNRVFFVMVFIVMLMMSIASHAIGTVYFSHSAGLYESGFSLELTTDLNGGVIYYTTDGSDPRSSATATTYTSPISIMDGDSSSLQHNDTELTYQVVDAFDSSYAPNGKTFRANVIRAYAKTSRAKTDVFVQSYLVDEKIFSRYADMAVVSLTVEPNSFAKNNPNSNNIAEDEGIYITVMNKPFATKERIPACFELIESDGTEVANQWVELSMHGNGSLGNMQKSMRIYFDEDAATGYMEDITLNKDNLKYDVFKGFSTNLKEEPIANFKRIVLRNSGNDAAETMIRDSYLARILEPLNLDVQSWRPSVVFVNGEFWGMYNIRERFDHEYFEKYYGILEENLVVIESPSPLVTGNYNSPYEIADGLESDITAWEELYNYIKNTNLSSDSNFNYVAERLDTDGFIDYVISQTFIHNNDWPGNNIKVWRNKNPEDPSGFDTKWRFLPMDMDHGFGYANCNQYNSNNFSTIYNNTSTICSTIFTKLMQNQTYKKKFINRYCEALDTVLASSVISPIWENMVSDIEPVMREHFNRWPVSNTHTYSTWTTAVGVVRTYAARRADNVYNQLSSTFGSANVPTQAYVSKLESPAANQKVTANTLSITGWAVSVSQTDGFYYVLDDQEPVAMTGTSRSDITQAYGGKYDTSKAVFSATCDITELPYGAHTLTVYCVIPSANNRAVGSTVTFYKEEPTDDFFCNLDYPKNNQAVNNGTLPLQGWAVHGGTTDHFVYIIDDGEEIYLEGYDRVDITDIYGITYDTSHSGFLQTLDVSALADGDHTIAVYAYSQNGKRVLVEEIRTFSINTVTDTSTVSVLESPTAGLSVSNGSLQLKGYALNANGISSFLYSIDSGTSTSVAPGRRTDLRMQYGNAYPTTVYRSCGLSATINVSSLAPGTHTLRVWYQLTNGQTFLVGGSPISFSIPYGKYLTHIDNFCANNQTAYIYGWAISENIPFARYEAVSAAGTFSIPIIQRPDVHTVYPGYASGNEGFEGFLDFSHAAPGPYTFELRGYYNDKDYVVLSTHSFERSTTPTVLSAIETEPQTPISDLAITFSGWALHSEGVESMYIKLDGQDKMPLALSARPDLLSKDLSYSVYRYKNGDTFDHAGFSHTIDLTKFIGANPLHLAHIVIGGVSKSGTEFIIYEKDLQFNMPYAKATEIKQESEMVISTNGWFVHNVGVNAFYIQFDDGELLSPTTGFVDLTAANKIYASFAATNDNFANSAFNTSIPLYGIKNGTHTIRYYAELKNGTRMLFYEATYEKNVTHNVTIGGSEDILNLGVYTIPDAEDYTVDLSVKDGYVLSSLSVKIDGAAYTLPKDNIIPWEDITGDITIMALTRVIEENIAPSIHEIAMTSGTLSVDMHLYTDRERVDAFTLYAAVYDQDGRMLSLKKEASADPIAQNPFTLTFENASAGVQMRFFYLSDVTMLAPVAPLSVSDFH